MMRVTFLTAFALAPLSLAQNFVVFNYYSSSDCSGNFLGEKLVDANSQTCIPTSGGHSFVALFNDGPAFSVAAVPADCSLSGVLAGPIEAARPGNTYYSLTSGACVNVNTGEDWNSAWIGPYVR